MSNDLNDFEDIPSSDQTKEKNVEEEPENRFRLAFFRFIVTFTCAFGAGLLLWGLNTAQIYFLPLAIFSWIDSIEAVLYFTLNLAIIAFISGLCNKQTITVFFVFILTPLYIYWLNAPISPKDQVLFFVTVSLITLFNVGFAMWMSSEDF